MKFKKIIETKILTEGRTKPISKNDAAHFIWKNCSQIINNSGYNNKFIFLRNNTDANYDAGILDPKRHHRDPTWVRPYPNLIVDNTSKWSQFPKRSKSIYFYVKLAKDEWPKFHMPWYAVFPEDGANIACAPTGDFSRSFAPWTKPFGDNLEFLHKFSKFIEKIYLIAYEGHVGIDLSYGKKLSNNFELLKSQLKGITYDKVDNRMYRITASTYSVDVDKFLSGWASYGKGKNLFEIFCEVLTTENFKRISPKYSFVNSDYGNECWTDAKCALVNISVLDEVLETVKNF